MRAVPIATRLKGLTVLKYLLHFCRRLTYKKTDLFFLYLLLQKLMKYGIRFTNIKSVISNEIIFMPF